MDILALTCRTKVDTQVNYMSQMSMNSPTQAIVKTVIERCKKESDHNQLCVAIQDYVGRAAYYTGLPKSFLTDLNEKQFVKPVQLKLAHRIAISKMLKQSYSSEKELSYLCLHQRLSEQEENFPEFGPFLQALSELGYTYVKNRKGQRILLENPKFTFERFRYLKKIREARSMNKHIYYIDAKIYNREDQAMVPVLKVPLEPSSKGVKIIADKMVMFYVVSKDGYDNGLFCFDLAVNDCMNWITHILMPLLKSPSLTIINNCPIFGAPGVKAISRYHSKKDMIKWLKEFNVPCTPHMFKAELYDLIEKCSMSVQNQNIDNIFKVNGHDVFRLPEGCRELSLPALLWQDLNNHLKETLNSEEFRSLTDVSLLIIKQIISQEIKSIPLNIWLEYDELIKKAEEDFHHNDVEIENILDQVEFDEDSICLNDRKWFE